MAKKLKDVVQFKIESRLLRELGEQLVSEPKIALTELVKNSYDADASTCAILYTDSTLVVTDDGHGMTFSEFESKWMSIATSNKAKISFSRDFHRKLTGSKGIGRFAARFLGSHLTLISFAYDPSVKKLRKLTAIFDWKKLDTTDQITQIKIPYTIEDAPNAKQGTILTIVDLRYQITEDHIKAVRNGMLHVTGAVSSIIPSSWLISPSGNIGRSKVEDPGFDLVIDDISALGTEEEIQSLTDKLLSRFVAKAEITVTSSSITTKIWHSGESHQKPLYSKKVKFQNSIGCNVKAILYWFPRRAGVFRNAGVDGRRAWTWVKENSGVSIFDHGFRISPYGLQDDDWLLLDTDNASNRRHWRSSLMKKHFHMDPETTSSTSLNPMLKLPANHQVIGAVVLHSDNTEDQDSNKLIPSMDRQGYVENDGYNNLMQSIRFGIELVAHFDKKIQLKQEAIEREDKVQSTRAGIFAAIEEIRAAPGLSAGDRKTIIQRYESLANNVEEIERYDRDSRASLETMSLLGVVAGFMTHEYEAALMELERASISLSKAAKKDTSLKSHADNLKNSVIAFSEYTEYTQSFIGNLNTKTTGGYKVRGTVQHVVDSLQRLSRDYTFEIDLSDLPARLSGPASVPRAVYQGVVMNLYTNAVKALIESSNTTKLVRIVAWEDGGFHTLQVMDTGKGIPDAIADRIWDPLFTTTSKEKGPLGTGMGLGLPLVRKVVQSHGGQISLISAPNPFATCFQVKFSLAKKG